jgi:hypothetical protein
MLSLNVVRDLTAAHVAGEDLTFPAFLIFSTPLAHSQQLVLLTFGQSVLPPLLPHQIFAGPLRVLSSLPLIQYHYSSFFLSNLFKSFTHLLLF